MPIRALLLICLYVSVIAFTPSTVQAEWVRSYRRKDGTLVRAHYRRPRGSFSPRDRSTTRTSYDYGRIRVGDANVIRNEKDRFKSPPQESGLLYLEGVLFAVGDDLGNIVDGTY